MNSKSIYLYHGEESYQVEKAAKAIEAAHPNAGKESLSDAKDLDEFLTKATAQSLFAAQSLFLIRDPWFLDAALDDKDIAKLEKCFEAVINQGHIAVLYTQGKKVDQRKKAVKLVKKMGLVQEFQPFKDWEQNKVYAWIKSTVTQLKRSITQDAIIALEAVGGSKLFLLEQTIRTLVTYCGERDTITEEDVLALTGDQYATVFSFTEALKLKNRKKILSIANHLFLQGENPIKMLGLVTSSLRLYLQLMILQQSGARSSDMAKQLGKNPFYIDKVMQGIRNRHTVQSLTMSMKALSKADLAMKTGQLEPVKAMTLCLATISR